VELLIGWLRSAANPQRRRANVRVGQPGSVNLKTGKRALGVGYEPSTINHQLAVLAGFYEFHLLFGERVDWGRQRIWVVSKGSRELSMVPGSPEAFDYLARYHDAFGTPAQERVWRTIRGASRP
jgi:hypothetical protein